MEDKEQKIKELYLLTEMTYIKNNNEKLEEDLFPKDWYSTNNYIKKIEILSDAIKNSITIMESEKYKEYQGISRKL